MWRVNTNTAFAPAKDIEQRRIRNSYDGRLLASRQPDVVVEVDRRVRIYEKQVEMFGRILAWEPQRKG